MKKIYFMSALLICITCGPAMAADENHPSIRQSLGILKEAKEKLENGEHGFGGHRAKAIEHIESAVKELQAALEYAELHPNEVKSSKP